ncbi:MAG TPA: TRAP transporter small permease [Roseateles sp.]|nr:TRAP transporter small permease [Roseateles sp.]
MRRLLDGLYAAFAALAALCVLSILVLMIAGSLGREFGLRLGFINDAVAWLCAAASFFAMAQAFKEGDFVRVTLLLERLAPPWRRRFELLSLGIAALAVGYLALWAARFTYESYRFNEIAGGMIALPIWIPQSSFVLGAVLFFIAVLDELVGVLRGRRPTYVTAVEARHAQGDFSGDI